MPETTIHKKIINRALSRFIREKLRDYGMAAIDRRIGRCITEFVLREGKRVRPLLFLTACRGYAPAITEPMITASLGFELLHDFLLVHDDIIDHSDLRRGKPTVHKLLETTHGVSSKIGMDLAIIIGDIIYALAIDAFNAFPTDGTRKTDGLRCFLRATARTGAGEYIDVLNGLKSLKETRIQDIRLNYLCKTAAYTFQGPLLCGCILNGGPQSDIRRWERYGACLGEAFQIQDDLIGLFSDSATIGKSVLSDLQEGKKTVPLYYAYQAGSTADRRLLQAAVGNPSLTHQTLQQVKEIITRTGALKQTTARLNRLLRQAHRLLQELTIPPSAAQQLNALIAACIKTG